MITQLNHFVDDPSIIVVGFVLVFAVVLAWLGYWICRHQNEVCQWSEAVRAYPRAMRIRELLAPPFERLQERVSPQVYFGLHLALGLLVLIAAGWLLGEIVNAVLTHDPLSAFDQRVSVYLNAHMTPWLTQVMFSISFIASGSFISVAAGLVALYLVWHRCWYRLLTWGIAVPGGSLLYVVLKHLVRRHRPVLDHPIATLGTYSFPSGHTLDATVFYGLLAGFAVISLKQWGVKVFAVLCAFFIVVLVGLSRVALGLHYFTDVLGGMSLGLAWLDVVSTGARMLQTWKSIRGA